MMVTGDHPLTAESIGRKINMMLQDTKETLARKRGVTIDQVPESDVNAIVIHGEQIDSLSEADWDNIFSKEEIIFARTSPKHKLTIVKHAQSLGHIVGVTGDGVNDSPALKKADLGIAMNQSGSDVSKEAAAMILIDDNFASAVNGIEEGRLIFQNLKKSIRYTVSHTMPQGNFYLIQCMLIYFLLPFRYLYLCPLF
jgi:sodium/potassium-transporting ATPase subunit alpha